jgi:hypothetical protein
MKIFWFVRIQTFLLNKVSKEVIETKRLVNIESDSNEEKAIIEIKVISQISDLSNYYNKTY